MPLELTVTAKGQVTLRQAVLDHLHVRPGDKIDVAMLPNGRVEIKAADSGHKLGDLGGMLRRPGQRVVSLEEMQEAIEQGAASEYRRR